MRLVRALFNTRKPQSLHRTGSDLLNSITAAQLPQMYLTPYARALWCVWLATDPDAAAAKLSPVGTWNPSLDMNSV